MNQSHASKHARVRNYTNSSFVMNVCFSFSIEVFEALLVKP